jgi:hypothetical protein
VEGTGGAGVGVAATSVAFGAIVGVAVSAAPVAVACTGDAAGCGGTTVHAARASAKVRSSAGSKKPELRGAEVSRTVITFHIKNETVSLIPYRAESSHLP